MRDRDRWRALSARERRLLVLGVLVLPFVTVGVRIAGFDAVRGTVARIEVAKGGWKVPIDERVRVEFVD